MKTNENFQLSTFNFQPDKRLAVVILNWNGRALMEEFLPSVVACTPGEWADVIVADNGSTDGSAEMLRAEFPRVEVLLLDRNYGYAGGYNRALACIEADYYILLNSDVETSPGWCEPLIAALDADPRRAGTRTRRSRRLSETDLMDRPHEIRICRRFGRVYRLSRLSVLPGQDTVYHGAGRGAI